MSDNFDDEMMFDDDDDLGFDDGLDMDFDPFAEEPKPKGRHPVTHSIIKTGSHFRKSLTEDKAETAKKVIKASIPSSVSNEASQVGDIVEGVSESLSEAKKEIKREAKPFLEALDKTIPKGGSIEKIVNLAKNKLGLDEEEPSVEQLAEDSANRAALSVAEILGEQRDREEYANILRDNIKAKRELSSIELQATTASNLEFINKFNQDVVSKYQRKSLELQYRHLYTADEQLALTKTAFDGFKNQLESIVVNSALPDLVKTHNSEFIKQKLFNKVTDGLFNSESVTNNIKNKFKREIDAIATTVSGGLGAATTLLDTKNTMSEMSGMTGGTEGMVGGILADGLLGYTGKKVGNVLGKTKVGKNAVSYFQDLMIDPSQKLKQQAEGKTGFMNTLLNAASDFTKRDSGEQIYKIDKTNRNEAVSFDGKTQTSITKIIPGLLSKILAEVKTIRTGNEEEELRFDYDKGTFETVSDMKSTINKTIDNSLKTSGVNRTINDLIKTLEKEAGLDVNQKDMMKLKEGLLGYVLTGKPLSPVTLKDNGFYRYFSKDISKKLEEAISKYTEDGSNKVRLNKELESIRNSAPDPMEFIGKYNDAGSMDILKEKGLMKYNETTGEYTLDNKKYKKILRNSLKNVKDDEVVEQKKDESIFNKVAVNYLNREKKPEEAKKQSNFSKMLDKAGEKLVNSIDRGTDYISEGNIKKDGRKLFHSGREYITGKKDLSEYKFSTEGSINNLAPTSRTLGSDFKGLRDTVKSIKTVDDAKNLIKKKIINTDEGIYDALSKTIKSSKDPKEFIKQFRETEEFKSLSKDVQDRLTKSSSIVKDRAGNIKDALVEDLEGTKAYKVATETSAFVKKSKNVIVNKFKASNLYKKLTEFRPNITKLYGMLGDISSITVRENIKKELGNLISSMIHSSYQEKTPKEVMDILNDAKSKTNSLDISEEAKSEFGVQVFEIIGLISSIAGIKRKELIGNAKTKFDNVKLKDSAISMLSKLGLKGFKTGGTTVGFKKDEVAGYVHGDEEVVESSRLDAISKILKIDNIKREDIVNKGINILGNVGESLNKVGIDLKDFDGNKKSPEDIMKSIATTFKGKKDLVKDKATKLKDGVSEAYDIMYAEDVKNKNFKNIANTSKVLGGMALGSAKDKMSDVVNDATLRTDRFLKEHLSKEQAESLREFISNIDEMKDNIKKNVNVKLFIETVTATLNNMEGFVKRNPEKSSNLETTISKIRNRLQALTKMDNTDTEGLKVAVKEINTDLKDLISRATPDSNFLSKKAEDFEKKDVKTDEDTFLDILNSDDPIGAMKYKIKQGIKNKIKGFAVKGATKLFNFGKNLVKKDLERGKKLRGYLKDKYENWKNDEPGAVRRAGNKALNKVGGLLSKGGKKTIDLAEKDVSLGKKLRDSIFSTVKKAVESKEEKKKNIFDKDGDGQRDGSWLSILMKRKKDKEANKEEKSGKFVDKVKNTAKSPIGIATILAGAAMGLKAMGVTLEDIKEFSKGAWDVLKGIGKVLGGVWDTLKTVGGWIRDAFGFIKKGLSKIPGIGGLFKSDHGGVSEDQAEDARTKLAKLEASGITSGEEYESLKSTVSKYDTAKAEDESSSGARDAGTAAAVLGTAYVAKKVAKPVVATYKVAKTLTTSTVSAVKGTSNVISKISGKTNVPIKGKVGGSKIMNMLKSFKDLILKKMGPIGGKKVLGILAAKIAARAIPFAGLALLAYDAGKIAYDMATNGTSLKSAVSKQILGFDLFSDDDLPTDENGEVIKPDEKEEDFYIKDQLAQDEKESNVSKITSSFKKTPDKRSQREYERAMNKVVNGFDYDLDKSKGKLTEEQYNKLVNIKKERDIKIKGKDTKVLTKPEESKKKSEPNSMAEFDALDNEYDREDYLSDLALYKPVSEWTRSDFELLIREVAIGPSEIVEYYYHNPEYLIKDVPPNENGYISPMMVIKKYNNIFGLRPRSASEEQSLRKRITAVIKNALDLKKSGKLKKIKEETNKKIDAQIVKDEKKDKKEQEKPVNNTDYKSEKTASNVMEKIANNVEVKTPVVKTETIKKTTPDITPVTNDLSTATKVAGPTMVETAKPTTKVIGNVADELKESNVTSRTNSVNAGIQTTNIEILTDTNKGIHKIGRTLDESLKVQKQMLEALNKFNSNTKLNDRELKMSEKEKRDVPVKEEKESSWDNIGKQEATKPNVSVGRKKYA